MRFFYSSLLLAALGLTSCKENTAKVATQETVPQVSVAKPILKKLTEWDEYTGRLEATQKVDLRARVSGHIEKIHFTEGSEVKAGDLLITIDPRPYQMIIDRSKAELERARTRAELAESEAKRAQQLINTRAIAAQDLETRLNATAEANAAVRSAEAALREAELNLEFTQVTAPISGRISYALVTAGNLITGGQKDSTLLTSIVSLNPIHCYFEVDEQAVLKYRDLHRQIAGSAANQKLIPIEMSLSDEKDYPRKGHIDFVDNTLRSDTGTIRTRGIFANEDKLMAPGLFARVRIPSSSEYEATLVRDEAIGSDQGQAYVYVINADNVAEYRTVELGPLHEGLRIVRSGIQADERLVVNGIVHVRNNHKVIPQEEPMLAEVATKDAP